MLIWRFLTYYVFLLTGLAIYGVRAIERVLKKRRPAEKGDA